MPQELAPEALQLAEQQLRQALAAPHEQAFAQILSEVRILRDELADSLVVYDLMVRYDPRRYRDPHVGLYPLTFEDQFILWGKRIAVYIRSTPWKVGRFYLHDLSTGRQAWISAEEARYLYRPAVAKLPPVSAEAFSRWLPLIHGVTPYTSPRLMSRWLQLMREESRDQVIQRLKEEAQSSPSILPGKKP